MPASDFVNRTWFPGTHHNPFDKLLRLGRFIENLPAPVFALGLGGLALLAAGLRWPMALSLFVFFLGDWGLLGALPLARKSFGPTQPPTLILAILRAPFALLPWPLAVSAQVIGTGLVLYGFWIEPHRLSLTRQTLRSAKLKPGQPPLRLLHLGDLHLERLTMRERQLLTLAQQLRPDIIVFSGDFLNLSYTRDPQAWAAVRYLLRQLAAPLGVYVVTGSPAVDEADMMPALLDGLPVRWLRDEKVTFTHLAQPVDLIGLTCTHKPFEDAPRLQALLPAPSPNFTLLLYHTPDLAPEAAAGGVDLQLSGHTHGGQVRLPYYGALYPASLYGKRYEAGRYQVETLTLYVTRGIGLEGEGAPRVRFLCPPEVTLWEITGPDPAA